MEFCYESVGFSTFNAGDIFSLSNPFVNFPSCSVKICYQCTSIGDMLPSSDMDDLYQDGAPLTRKSYIDDE